MPRKNRTPESLALNRENQRRSRARHRELLVELQRRVRDYERRDGQATLEMQRVARVVNAENVALRNLLAARGVPTEDVEAHLQTARAKLPVETRSALPPSSKDLAGDRELRRKSVGEMQNERRLDVFDEMPSPALSASSSVLSSTRLAPASSSPATSTPLPPIRAASCSGPSLATHAAMPVLQPIQAKSCSPVVPIPRVNNGLVTDRPLPPLQPDVSAIQRQNCQGEGGRGSNGIQLPMFVGHPPDMAQTKPQQAPTDGCCARSNLKPKLGCDSNAQSKNEQDAKCQPVPKIQHHLGDQRFDETHCVEAANILAQLRGDSDESAALAALGCSENRDCMVRNADLLQLMD
ncbi:hypothetical protein BGZ63DRAFT_103349 [Mariannaea sp. PMI_226]|nr:hypothetical protein BGZ63DRAFT_103349 [Mariannaea sp. PMI_226]